MPDDEPVLARGCPPVLAVDDLQVGAADADRLGLDQDGPVIRGRLRHVGERDGAWLAGDHGDGAHDLTLAAGLAVPGAGGIRAMGLAGCRTPFLFPLAGAGIWGPWPGNG